jgi:hypothetical protein
MGFNSAMAEKSFVNESAEMAPPELPVVVAPPVVAVAPVVVAPPVVVGLLAAAVVAADFPELSLPQATRPPAMATATDAMHARLMEDFIVITSLVRDRVDLGHAIRSV